MIIAATSMIVRSADNAKVFRMWSHHALRALVLFLLGVCATPRLSHAQEPSQQPEAGNSGYEDVHTLAARLLKSADAADCHKDNCKLLVMNLVLPTDHGSVYGMSVADSLSHEIQTQEPAIQVIDRAALYSYLETQRIPSENSSDSMLRAIGADLQATTVVVGTTKRVDDNTVELSARMLSVDNKDHIGNSAEVNLFAPLAAVDLSPSEPYPSLPPITQTSTGEAVYRAGTGGVSLPSCTYMPNPPLTDTARRFKVDGMIMIEAVLSSEGKLEDLRILKGLPAGMDQAALETLKSWRCKPSQKDGKPVPVVVPFELNFRLY